MQINKSMNTFLLLLCLSLMTFGLQAWSVSDAYLGNQIQSFDARLNALGNAGVYNEYRAMALTINPANASINIGQLGLQANAMLTRNADDRSFPLYNTFDAYLDDATYSSNINIYDEYGLAGFAKKHYGKMTSAIGMHYQPFVNFEGKYDEEVRSKAGSDSDTYPVIFAINRLDNTGHLNNLGLTFSQGYEFTDLLALHLGFTIASISGENKSIKSVHWTNDAQALMPASSPIPDSTFTSNSEISGNQFKFGTNLKVNERLGVGIVYSPKAEFNRDTKLVTNQGATVTTGQVADKYILPTRVRLGFNYKPRNVLKTDFNVDVEYVKWEDISKFYDNAWDLHVGVEHRLENRIPIRLGFQSLTEWLTYPDYSNIVDNKPFLNLTKVITPSITAGSSVVLARNVTLDLGLSYSWREYEAVDIFKDGAYSYPQLWTGAYVYLPFADRGWSNPDKVRETNTQLSTGITWTW